MLTLCVSIQVLRPRLLRLFQKIGHPEFSAIGQEGLQRLELRRFAQIRVAIGEQESDKKPRQQFCRPPRTQQISLSQRCWLVFDRATVKMAQGIC